MYLCYLLYLQEVDVIKRCQADMQTVVDKSNAQLA